jgi:hypothetical protein
MKIEFEHRQAAHCESGVTSNLLRVNSNGKITEPLAFGIGAGLFFAHIPFIKINNGPAIAFRTLPGHIFNRTCKSLGIPLSGKSFFQKKKLSCFYRNALIMANRWAARLGYITYPISQRNTAFILMPTT